MRKGFDIEKASELLDYYDILLKGDISPAMEEAVKSRMERLHSLLHGTEFLLNKARKLENI